MNNLHSPKSYLVTLPPPKIGLERDIIQIYHNLIEGQDEFITSPFKNLQQSHIFLVAMAIGAARGKRKPLINRVDVIPQQMIANSGGEALMVVLAIVEEQSPFVVSDRLKIYTIAEEYANGGIQILLDQILNIRSEAYLELENQWRMYISEAVKASHQVSGRDPV